jgi:hypothetical protein
VACARLQLWLGKSFAPRNKNSCPARAASDITRTLLRQAHADSIGGCRPSRALPVPLIGLALAGFMALANPAGATWKPEYASAAPEVQEWYRSAQLTDAAQKRFGFKSCCAHSDVVKTEFRVDKATKGDEWYWLNDGQWSLIPTDIIHWGESAPGQQPTLFAIGNLPTCFYPGQGGL